MTEDRIQLIRERAYELWELECCPEGRALDHWLCAESEAETEEDATARTEEATLPSRKVRAGQK